MRKVFAKISVSLAEWITGTFIYKALSEYDHARLIVIFGSYLDLDHMPEGLLSKKRIQWWCRALKGEQ
jgi:hypothetical protein